MDREALGHTLARLMGEAAGDPDLWADMDAEEKETMRRIASSLVSPPSRTFYARVSLMGHRDLGLCRVTEAMLAGVPMLRCETPAGVEWVNPTALYSAREVPDDEALAEIAAAVAEKERKRVLAAEREAALRAERAEITVDVITDTKNNLSGLRASRSGYLRPYDGVDAALAAEGFPMWSGFSDADGNPVGIVVEGVGHEDALCRVVESLGFKTGCIRTPSPDDELDEDIPF